MELVASDVQAPWRRQRRAHRKPRHGCRNCKLRQVKCDEAKPRCAECRLCGVVCDYAGPSTDLQLTQELKMPPLVATDGSSSCELDEQCLAGLRCFQFRTIKIAINVPPQPLLQRAMGSPILMHAIVTFTEAHDRYLNRRRPTAPDTRELCHVSIASALFSRRLSSPIQPDDCDTIWDTATFLDILAFTSIPVTTTEACWPLRQGELSWLCLTLTESALWKLTNPLRPESLLDDMSEQYSLMYAPRQKRTPGDFRDPRPLSFVPGDEALSDLYHLCCLQSFLGFTPSLLVDVNPYQETFK
ncbi:hypothetical protein N8T08_000767 [Aspergillus melleus]|uniref:Uncharacterized protein n=1 Tax=Aspergillus melleus TaxID=138277 RepID=A0ACC3APR5_9EURO|nr:hypothetical protein N8T08_000767 [Aspergillus melleus]